MRILMLTQFFPPIIGGEERHVKVLSEALVRRGHDVSVATIKQGDQPDVEVQSGVTIHRLQGSLQRNAGLFSESQRRHAPPFPDPELMFRLNRILRAERPDVVHAHNWLLHSYLPLQRIYKQRLVVTLHDYSIVCAKKSMIRDAAPCSGPAPLKCLPCASQHYGAVKGAVTWLTNASLGRMGLSQVDTFIAVSNSVASRCGMDPKLHQFEVIPTFIAEDVGQLADGYENYLSLLPKSDFMLFVGDLMRLKGVHTLIEAYRRMANAPPLVLIGRRCKDTPNNLPPNVTMLDSWPHAAILHAWNRCLFGIAPSEGLETCGTVVMEANAFGKPVVACRTGGLPETVADGKTGILVPPADVEALRGALVTMSENHDLREKMGEASRVHVGAFMSEAVVPRIERIYEGGIGVSRAGRLQ
ncbi:glycosyltransferase family 4 protein [Hyphomicrobium sp.]|uniref:glycosyltransferase family 4 protein n=1 Tax=Hyphomicrobium sp. TaxID=82 RepID=UPI002D78CA06|nr:glycosyltransferase family 4 protein [Hyphomicrobium sp.]HET6391058.1 glycosyltransferase family 4 protein [Hyphomicrobium sp.]